MTTFNYVKILNSSLELPRQRPKIKENVYAIYEYQCEKCGETAEVLQKFSDAPVSQCLNCGGPMHKLMSMNSFQLKGNGWYVTDYAGKTATKKDCGDAPACGASSPETKSDSACCKGCDKATPPACS